MQILCHVLDVAIPLLFLPAAAVLILLFLELQSSSLFPGCTLIEFARIVISSIMLFFDGRFFCLFFTFICISQETETWSDPMPP